MKAVLAAGFRAREEYHEMLVMQLRFDRLVVPLRVLLAVAVHLRKPGEAGAARAARLKCAPRRLGVEPKGRDGAPARTGRRRKPERKSASAEPGRDWVLVVMPTRLAAGRNSGETGVGGNSGRD
jgi:hypothetical protein